MWRLFESWVKKKKNYLKTKYESGLVVPTDNLMRLMQGDHSKCKVTWVCRASSRLTGVTGKDLHLKEKKKRKTEYISSNKIQAPVVCKTKAFSVLCHDNYVEILIYIKKCWWVQVIWHRGLIQNKPSLKMKRRAKGFRWKPHLTIGGKSWVCSIGMWGFLYYSLQFGVC